MCGISGIVSPHGIDLETLSRMNRLIRHRGPDDEGFVLFREDWQGVPARGEDTSRETWERYYPYKPSREIPALQETFFLGLGHRRLSILDLSPAGHMPMCDPEERYWITYNGEVYNFPEIRRELKALGYHFRTETDTEVILAAYRAWGRECLHKFMGMFAFALADTKERTLFLARDRFGIKPLYYWVSPRGALYFASEIKQFTVAPGWRPRLNHQRAFDYLYAAQTDHTEETLIEGVYQLRGGHAVTLDLSKQAFTPGASLKADRWYNPEVTPFTGSFEEARDLFREKFYESVRLHLRADVRVGCTLSGGFDSSSITCTVNELLRQNGQVEKHHTFSAVDGDSKYSEQKWIEAVVRQLNVTPHFHTPSPEEALNDLGALAWKMDEPTGSMSPYLGYLVDRMARQNGVTVLLNGQGADEYLAGYGAFRRAARLRVLNSLSIPAIRREYGCSSARALRMATRAAGRRAFAGLFPRTYARAFNPPEKSKPWLACLDLDILRADLDPWLPKGEPVVSSYQDISTRQLHAYPLPMFLRWEDRNSMAHSVEARVPFLDHRLVEFCHSLPQSYVEVQGQSKRILLEAMQEVLPAAIYHRKDKMGYVAPEERWVKKEYTRVFRKRMEESVRYTQGILKPEETLSYFDEVATGDASFTFTTWRLILFGFWMKRFDVKLFN